MTDDADAIKNAIIIALKYAGIEGDHHRAWVIDQMVRALTRENYDSFVDVACVTCDGVKTLEWDEGIPP